MFYEIFLIFFAKKEKPRSARFDPLRNHPKFSSHLLTLEKKNTTLAQFMDAEVGDFSRNTLKISVQNKKDPSGSGMKLRVFFG